MNDAQLQQALLQIWWPYCASFIDSPTLDRLEIQVTSGSITGLLRITSYEWSRLSSLAPDFQTRFESAFDILCDQLDPHSRGNVFSFGQIAAPVRRASPDRLAVVAGTARRTTRLSLVAEAPAPRTASAPRSAAKLVKKAAPKGAPKKSAPADTLPGGARASKPATKTAATPARRTPVTKTSRTRSK